MILRYPWQANTQQPSQTVTYRLDPLLDSGGSPMSSLFSPQQTGAGRTGGPLYLSVYTPPVVTGPVSPQQTGKGRTGGPLYWHTSAPVVPPIAFNLNPWAAVSQSSDSDPLAVDASQAVQVN